MSKKRKQKMARRRLTVESFIELIRQRRIRGYIWVSDPKLFKKMSIKYPGRIRKLRGKKIWENSLKEQKEWEGAEVQAIVPTSNSLIILTLQNDALRLY